MSPGDLSLVDIHLRTLLKPIVRDPGDVEVECLAMSTVHRDGSAREISILRCHRV